MTPELMATKTGTHRAEQIGTAMLEQLAELDARSLSPATARKLLDLNFSEAQNERASLLSEKASESSLNPAERQELEEFIRVADLLAILQARARRALKQAGSVP